MLIKVLIQVTKTFCFSSHDVNGGDFLGIERKELQTRLKIYRLSISIAIGKVKG